MQKNSSQKVLSETKLWREVKGKKVRVTGGKNWIVKRQFNHEHKDWTSLWLPTMRERNRKTGGKGSPKLKRISNTDPRYHPKEPEFNWINLQSKLHPRTLLKVWSERDTQKRTQPTHYSPRVTTFPRLWPLRSAIRSFTQPKIEWGMEQTSLEQPSQSPTSKQASKNNKPRGGR